MSFDSLQDKIRARKNPIAVVLDPEPEYIPPCILAECLDRYGRTPEGAAEAAFRFSRGVMDALADSVPAVVFRAAGWERFGWRGMEALERAVRYGKERGFFVIADVKRGDVGPAARACAAGWLGGGEEGAGAAYDADCVTLNGYLGSDAAAPFLEVCRAADKCVFVVVKTANPSSGELQDLVAGDRVVWKVMGELTQRLDKGGGGSKYGFSAAGAVVGSAYPSDLRELRRRLEKTFFLVPDSGGPGMAPQDLRYAFDPYGRGAVVEVARPILCAWQRSGGDGGDYQAAARAAALAAGSELKQYIQIL